MNIAVVDDEKLALDEMVYTATQAIKDGEIDAFNNPLLLLEAAKNKKYDIVFSDIQMPNMHGIELAKQLKQTNPKMNIIFVTGYSDYKDDAIRLHASGYIRKPVTVEDVQEEMDNLLHPVETPTPKIYAQTFGNFCFFVNGEPVHFRRDREQEMLAYLIDRNGSAITRKEIGSIMFEDGDFSRAQQVYLSLIAHDLAEDMDAAGAKGVFVKKGGNYRVDVTKFSCDAYDYLAGDTSAINKFSGEYMEQYSWAEYLKSKFYK